MLSAYSKFRPPTEICHDSGIAGIDIGCVLFRLETVPCNDSPCELVSYSDTSLTQQTPLDKYALFTYTSGNVGDEVQSIAASHFLPR